MANTFLKILFGLYPGTDKIERERSSLVAEYDEIARFSASEDFAHYLELEKYITSNEFGDYKRSIESKRFETSDEFQKLHQYLQSKKSKPIVDYYKTKKSKDLQKFNRIQGSSDILRFEQLEKVVASKEFHDVQASNDKKAFKATEQYRLLQEYSSLKTSKSIKFYYKYKASPLYANFIALDGSKQITDYEELEKFVNTDEFKQAKDFLKDKKRFQKTEAFQKEQEYLKLKKSDKIAWYFKVKDSNKFDKLKQWTLTFEDDFTSGKLDTDKWITRYFWGEALLNDTYSMLNDKQHYTNGENLEFNGSVVKIITKKQKAKGKTWNPMFGFVPSDFDYTSGLISTGQSFRQKYGRFEAKIRLNKPTEVTHAFWMVGETILPQVDFFKYEGNKLFMSNFWGKITEKDGVKKNVSKISASRFANGFFIYTLDWTPEKLEWKINGLTVKTQTEGIPQEPMYVILNSIVNKPVSDNSVPATMEIDWVRCYQKA
jgi:hypothetical protein